MSFFKNRTEPELLRCMRIIHTRMDSEEDVKKYYLNLEKGYKGEIQFDLLMENLQSNCFILNDLLLEINSTAFQIDTLIIFQDTAYIFEVKNFEGDFCYDSDRFLNLSGKEFKNPLNQLNRTSSLFRQLLQNLKINLQIEAYVIFINPEFTLYQAPTILPFIYPTQLNRLLKKLNSHSSRLNNLHKKLAEKLVNLHQTESPFPQLPKYEYQQVKKGITCKSCHSFSVTVNGKIIVCVDCGCEELVESAVMRCVEEIKLLFPDLKITTNEVYEWCRVFECSKRIRRILVRNFNTKGICKWTVFD